MTVVSDEAFNTWALKLSNELNAPPPKDAKTRMEVVKVSLLAVSDPPREALETLYFAGVNIMELQQKEWQRRDRIYAMLFGVATLIFMATVAIVVPDPRPFPLFVFRLIASLGAGGVGAFLPGLFNITITRPSLVVRATSALGFAVLVYLVNPPALASH
jgi:hypothetical protein